MRAQAAVNIGNRGTTPESLISTMLENGFNCFVLKYKRQHNGKIHRFGFDIVELTQQSRRGGTEVYYKAQIGKGEMTFTPDEMEVPVAYCPDTPRNRDIMALEVYTAPYYISSLITNTGTIIGETAEKDIVALAEKKGVKKPERSRFRGVYGNTLADVKAKNAAAAAKKALAQTPAPAPDISRSVFKTEEAKAAIIPKESEPTPPAADAVKLTQEECLKEAERIVFERLKPLVDLLRAEKKQFWRKSKYYREAVQPELQKEKTRLLLENGLQPMIDDPAGDPTQPDPNAPQAE
jgi:hypothetical protein